MAQVNTSALFVTAFFFMTYAALNFACGGMMGLTGAVILLALPLRPC